MSFEVDPVEVLSYLNCMGFKNISPQQLKDFIRDLKKLIKYELRHGKLQGDSNPIPDALQRMTHQKTKKKDAPVVLQSARVPKRPDWQPQFYEKENVRPRSAVARRTDNDGDGNMKIMRLETAKTPTINCVRNNPVDLYQKYQKDWERFKKFMPGENEHTGLRRHIREKLMVKDEPKKTVFVCLNEESGLKHFKRL